MVFETAKSDEALVITGCCISTTSKVIGPRSVWIWPGQKFQRLCLKTFTVNISSKEINTCEGIQISCVGIAQVKIQESNSDMFETACSMFLNKLESDIEKAAIETIEGTGTSTLFQVFFASYCTCFTPFYPFVIKKR